MGKFTTRPLTRYHETALFNHRVMHSDLRRSTLRYQNETPGGVSQTNRRYCALSDSLNSHSVQKSGLGLDQQSAYRYASHSESVKIITREKGGRIGNEEEREHSTETSY